MKIPSAPEALQSTANKRNSVFKLLEIIPKKKRLIEL